MSFIIKVLSIIFQMMFEKKYYFNFGISTDKDGKIIGSFEFLEYNETEDFYYWIAFEEMKK